jgi:hypothetical protein
MHFRHLPENKKLEVSAHYSINIKIQILIELKNCKNLKAEKYLPVLEIEPRAVP